ncbi:MAG: BatD family protein, partial [Hallella sp.]|nr:BatD family protein [Hallella sp.]
MTRRLKYILLVACLLWGVVVGRAQISVSVPTHVATGENFRLAYTIKTQDVSDFRAGNIPDELEVLAGPYTSRQSSYQMVNGHTSSS